jgi:hypothetical protein
MAASLSIKMHQAELKAPLVETTSINTQLGTQLRACALLDILPNLDGDVVGLCNCRK